MTYFQLIQSVIREINAPNVDAERDIVKVLRKGETAENLGSVMVEFSSDQKRTSVMKTKKNLEGHSNPNLRKLIIKNMKERSDLKLDIALNEMLRRIPGSENCYVANNGHIREKNFNQRTYNYQPHALTTIRQNQSQQIFNLPSTSAVQTVGEPVTQPFNFHPKPMNLRPPLGVSVPPPVVSVPPPVVSRPPQQSGNLQSSYLSSQPPALPLQSAPSITFATTSAAGNFDSLISYNSANLQNRNLVQNAQTSNIQQHLSESALSQPNLQSVHQEKQGAAHSSQPSIEGSE